MAFPKFQHSYSHYADRYGCSIRTIARYAKAGFDLDNEERCRIQIATQRTRGPTLASTGPGPSARLSPAGESLGLSASIQRLQEEEAAAHAEYKAAVQANDAILASNKVKVWKELCEQLRKTSQTSPEVAEANKQSISLSELQSTLNDLFNQLRQDLDTLPRRVALELVGKDELGIRESLAREIGEIISGLYSCKYLLADE